MSTTASPAVPSSQDSTDATPVLPQRRPWTPPKLTDFGEGGELTEGVSYNPFEGIDDLRN